MPLNCTGNEFETGCGIYSGPDIPGLGIQFGDNLDDVLVKIATATTATVQPTSQSLTSDDITSKSLVRNNGSINAANIIKRDFSYSLTATTGNATVLSWDMIPIIHQLPSGYEAALVRVKATGKPTTGSNVIVDSRSPGATLVISTDRYPVTVDFLIRVTSPSGGNIDLETTIDLVNPSITGSYRAILDAKDLNPQSGVLSLTEHLNSIEGQIANLSVKQESLPNLSVDVETQKLAVEALQESVATPGSLPVNYAQDGSNFSGELGALITDLYAQIKNLKDKDSSQQAELQNLRSQIDSLT